MSRFVLWNKTLMWRKYKRFTRLLVGSFSLILSCSFPEGLEPVSGVEGEILFKGIWPDSVLATSLIVLEELNLDSLEDVLISYSDPVLQGDTLSYYFIQLKPGGYYMVSIGLTIEPGLFFTKLDSFITAPEIPIVPLGEELVEYIIPFAIQDEEITLLDVIITF